MQEHQLSATQNKIVYLPNHSKVFLEGPAGTGKTTVGVERMLHLMNSGVAGNTILVLVPQRTLGIPYVEAMNTPGVVAGGMVSVVTLSGLAQRMVELFWSVVADQVGFSKPENPPIFVNLEAAQYFMAHLVRPLFSQGYFSSLTIDRNRLYSQIIDNLNKAAVVGFPYQEIGNKLRSAWSGEPGQSRVYEDTQTCAALFREYCLENNLLDFSLQIEVFWKHLWRSDLCRNYLTRTYNHLIVDNIEEDVPVTHDLLAAWVPQSESCLLIYDSQAGYRRFLGADPLSAYGLKEFCSQSFSLTDSFVQSQGIRTLSKLLQRTLARETMPMLDFNPRLTIIHETHAYYPQMLDWVAEQIRNLSEDEGVDFKQIAVLAPFLSDSLRFSIVNRLHSYGVPTKTHRPSRSLREEPSTLCLVTLAALAHPDWGVHPTKFDVAHSLMQAIAGMDLIRAKILTDIVFRMRDGTPTLSPFEQIIPNTQERISYLLGEKYERLRLWLADYQGSVPGELDHFISRLFGEVLSQPGFGFHSDFDKGQVAANLVDSIRKFRRVVGNTLIETGMDLGKEYIQMLNDGVIAAQYFPAWQAQQEQAVFIAPAYSFLTNNYPVDIQFWLDIGSRSWAERLYQPLTHPYVLSRNWPEGKAWTDAEEVQTGDEVLSTLVYGLLNRCRKRIYLGLSEYNEQGYEQRGPLLQAFHRILQSYAID
jgi:hypothetical protein